MKITLFLIATIICTNLLAETKVSAFFALDLLKIKSIENQDSEYTTGVGALSMKMTSKVDKFAGRIKLDLDDSAIGGADFVLFEEAYVTYYHCDHLSFVLGKGKVPFTKNQRGAISDSMTDGGSLLGTELYWGEIKNQNIMRVKFGNRKMGFFNKFTIYADVYGEKTFDFAKKRGVVNKFEFFPMKGLYLSVAAGYYHDTTINDDDEKVGTEDWSATFAGNYTFDNIEIFFEYLNGHAKGTADRYRGIKKHTENIYQIGTNYKPSKDLKYVATFELGSFNTTKWSDNIEKKQTNIKLEAGPVFSLKRNILLSLGGSYETAATTLDGGSETTQNGYQFSSSIAFWF